MGLCKRLTVITALVVLGVAVYYGSFKVPDGTTITGRLTLSFSRVVIDVVEVASLLGLGEPALMLKGAIKNVKTDTLPTVQTEDFMFDGIPVRLYKTSNVLPGGAGIVFIHGGGWTLNSVDGYNDFVGDITEASGMTVVSIEYRLAPEHIFPAAFDDCVKATSYFLKHADKFNVDPKRVAIVGDSAGGNLAAAVSLKHGSKLKAQVLIYPALQAFDFDTTSYQITGPLGPLLTKKLTASFWLYYAQGHIKNLLFLLNNNHTSSPIKQSVATSYVNIDSLPEKYIPKTFVKGKLDYGNTELWKELQGVFLNPYFAPLAAPDVSTVPQALIFTAEYDVLRDDGILYYLKLKGAGVQVSHHHFWDGIHGMINFPGKSNSQGSEKMFIALIKFLSDTL